MRLCLANSNQRLAAPGPSKHGCVVVLEVVPQHGRAKRPAPAEAKCGLVLCQVSVLGVRLSNRVPLAACQPVIPYKEQSMFPHWLASSQWHPNS